jgi:branched-chain amino acid transport system permease protein
MIAQQLANSLALGGAYALMSLGFALIFGVLDLIHWSYGDVMILAAYITVTLLAGFSRSFALVLVAVVGVSTLLGVVVERFNFHSLRDKSHMAILIASLGVAMMLQNAILVIWGPARKVFMVNVPIPALSLLGIRLSGTRALSLGLSLVVMVALDFLLHRTRLGMAIRATILDRDAATLMGINRRFILVSTFAMGSALSGIAMLLLGSMYGVIYPLQGNLIGLLVFAAVMIGGLGSIPGAVLGGFIIGFSQTLSAAYISLKFNAAITMSLLVLMLIIRPRGFLGNRQEENI